VDNQLLVDLVELWRREEQRPFTGWDFSYLADRMVQELPAWSYASRAAELMRQAGSVLELGTGGGERFLQLREHWPSRVTVTEEYPPNVALVRARLGSLGVRVVEVRLTDIDPLPFATDEFDVVLNRHSAFNSAEVARVLGPGGTFLTQQVHGRWAEDLLAEFDATPPWPDSTPDKYVPLLEGAGLRVADLQEWTGRLVFKDVGAIVYYLKAVPWLVPGFSVASNISHLLRLQARLVAGEELAFTGRTYLIEARQPRQANY
jgi:SAM-dependent methyltransferase